MSAKLTRAAQEVSHGGGNKQMNQPMFYFIQKLVIHFILVCGREILGQIMKLADIQVSFRLPVRNSFP